MSDQNSIINVSTEYSLDRSVISIADIVEKAKSMYASTVIIENIGCAGRHILFSAKISAAPLRKIAGVRLF